VKRKRRKNSKAKLPPVSVLARRVNPFDEPGVLLKRLKKETSESRHVEWKITPPFGPAVTTKIKCRMVKVLTSFANTDGGFIVFGVDPRGKWVGFSEDEIKDTDAAKIAELVNECVSPELVGLNYGLLRTANRLFPVLHVPPSQSMPHVTIKEIGEKQPGGSYVPYVRKYAVYCRYTAKSDLATAAQYARIIAQRTEMLRSEMLRVVKKVDVPVPVSTTGLSSAQKPIIRVSRVTGDKTAPAMRITRNPAEATGVIVQEELSQGLFSEINNVLEANRLLAPDNQTFVLGENVYYRVYAERQHVEEKPATFRLLANTALLKMYAPSLFWLLTLPAAAIAEIILSVLANSRSQNIHLICRLVILLGPKATEWLAAALDQEWKGQSQPPDHYFSFNKMQKLVDGDDLRVIALQQSPKSKIALPAGDVLLKDLLADSQLSKNYLSKTCLAVFDGDRRQRPACRQLDILAYGSEFPRLCNSIMDELSP
jgi:schlafen family protein